MFVYHVNNSTIILILLCTFLCHAKTENVKNAKCQGISSVGRFNYGQAKRSRWQDAGHSKGSLKIGGEDRRYKLLEIPTGGPPQQVTPLFLNGCYKRIGCSSLHKKRKNFSLYKKKKDKGGAANVKKKEKKVFTEEEIEELRRRAKEKLQPKKGDADGISGGKTKKGGKGKKNTEQVKGDKKSSKEELQKLDDTEDSDTKQGNLTDYIKSKEDFDKIVDLTKDLINEKEVQYIHKISDCDEELLTYDKREKNIQLNFEDTLFDEGNYMHNYVNNISKFRFDIYNLHNKNEFDRITKYLNYQYIEEVPVEIPTERSYNIGLKKYFYEVVCDLVGKYRDKFESEPYTGGEEQSGEDQTNGEQISSSRLSMQKGKINQHGDDTGGEEDNETLNNFLKENKQEENKTTTMDKIENMASVIQPTHEDIMNKYMSHDLYNLLCDIKDEYDYMFENGGLEKFSFDQNRKTHKEKLIFSGKKKRAVAMVFLQRGNNNLIINNRDGYQYLQYQIFNINKIFSPLLHLCMHRHFNVVARVVGGGLSGQSVAIFHALVKYIVYNLSLKIKPYFRSFKFMTVDSRKVERKKYGLKKARKKKQYSKR
ncbi:30S ribosomal protein S9, putative [Plasmodium knowlesi strain H]|uniref:30S ribosomal protein S9, putative n=3 Tax=Plasmodium knowlesi TaxID=5850 RepID=A0A5K1U8S1_PLAKH|nr:30S ribosomal protein S9, putative [Plasmodium knowlesi strain H]OTN67703.1 putative 30S ribosomal protein S9 [Plasmodium knowlesi]CAA9990474.1 30S ribosomal protein S9, putative [Plasmodium knowlesi strain H]SBO19687.1 30S ribosomal protein S9, putative [Plasmodium knowlesi strain H]SBO22489.1 30S ribosomal protein S9, putative [Plasmodium knowlesi strain H]VVS79948.1 30S ribosomal protein S9, putative [Plasmodium knowlesi strain H]|eukprot:XP_002260863.1 ribosomal protein S9, putative [Plasmodium knowlesi strain H]